MQLYVDKNTDQMRSTFIAFGLAELLYRIPPLQSNHRVTIYDYGSCYGIASTVAADELTQNVVDTGFLKPLLPAISKPLTARERSQLEAGQKTEAELLRKYLPQGYETLGGTHIKYGEEKKIFDAHRKYRPKKNDTRDEDSPPAPHRDFPVWAHLNSYFGKGSAMRVGYPGLVHSWHAHQGGNAFSLWQLIQYCYGSFPNMVEQCSLHWEQEVFPHLQYADQELATQTSALAIVSPSTSKGASSISGFNRLVEDTPTGFWLELYFAFAGFMSFAMPFSVGGDVVTYYPLPTEIDLTSLHRINDAHRNSSTVRRLYSYSNTLPRAKLDVLNQISFYTNMVGQFIEQYNDGTLPEGTSIDAIKGVVGFYYKDISSQIPFDETLFAVPAWLPLQLTPEVLEQAYKTLDSHYKLIYALRGRPPKYQITADELSILESYRRYMTHGDADDWIRFAIRYGMYRFRNVTEMSLPVLSLQLFEESFPMVINDRKDYRPILDNPGFQKIAGAIGYCTSYARYKKDVQKDRTFPFKVRHGLGDDLMRNAHDPELFLLDLSTFIHDYRRESINVQANTGKSRSEIEPQDIHDVTGLVADYGSRIVAHLLVATGYAARFRTEN